ncbi:MAG: DUF1684 domain-containing protein [Dokdonella sp.]
MKILLLVVPAVLASVIAFAGSPADDMKPASPTATVTTPPDADYARSIDTWHAEREARLRKPDGWLSYIGSGRVDVGSSEVGHADDNDIVLSKGPDKLGTLVLSDKGALSFTLAEDNGATIDGSDATSATLKTNIDGDPTRIRSGTTSFYVVKSGYVVGWRQKDTAAESLHRFAGIDRYPVDPSWRIVADWVAFVPPKKIDLVTVINTLEPAEVPGKAVFQRDGKTFELQPVAEDDQLFFILTDATSGKETYAAARFLYTDAPKDGKVIIDFNKAVNPPCALSEHVVCPTAPKENRLALPIEAGEKKFAHGH